jgi:large subunit ribosomal protein L18
MKLSKKENRLRRARRGRSKIRELEANRLSVHRTPQHIYAQVIGAHGNKILAAASTLEAEVRKGIKNGGNVEAAAIVGARIAEKAKAAGIDTVAFDRSGFRYHGRVKALADAAREAGLKF